MSSLTPILQLKRLVFSKEQRTFDIYVLFALILVSSVLESIGLISIVPFVQLIGIEEGAHFFHPYQIFLSKILPISSKKQLIVASGSLLILMHLSKNLFLVWYYKKLFSYNNFLKNIVATKLYNTYLEQPYIFHVSSNSNDLSHNVRNINKLVDNILTPLMALLAESFILLAIIGVLLWVQPLLTLFVLALLCGAAVLFYVSFKKDVSSKAKEAFVLSSAAYKLMHDSLNCIKEVKLNKSYGFFLERFESLNKKVFDLVSFQQFTAQLPKLIIESLMAFLVVSLVLVLTILDLNLKELIPTLILFVAGFVRLMPSFNKVIISAISIKEGISTVEAVNKSVDAVYEEFNSINKKPVVSSSAKEKIAFEALDLKDISYSYPSSGAAVLKNISLTINKGDKVAFVGPTGSGKTTLIDCVLGLLKTSSGSIYLNGKNLYEETGWITQWQNSVGYVPQKIVLLDDTIVNNIAFGQEKENIDQSQMDRVIKWAKLDHLMKNENGRLHGHVGERGVMLSGGEIQRVGIARALYRNPSILIFDEATSSLDNKTEEEISSAIQKLSADLTVIYIAHRLSTIRHCNKIYFMKEGRVTDCGNFMELKERNDLFRKYIETQSEMT